MIGRAAAAFGVAIALVVSGCGSDDDGSTEPDPSAGFDIEVEFEVVDGEPVGGSRDIDIDVDIGDHVRITLRGNSEESVHVHAYDLFIEPIDGSGELVFDAFIPGTFEIELEGSGRLLARMKVS